MQSSPIKPPKWKPRSYTPYDPPTSYELRYENLISMYNQEWNVGSPGIGVPATPPSGPLTPYLNSISQSVCSEPPRNGEYTESPAKQDATDDMYIKMEPCDLTIADADVQMGLNNQKEEPSAHLDRTQESKPTRKPHNSNNATSMITYSFVPPCVQRTMYRNLPWSIIREVLEWKGFGQLKVPERYTVPFYSGEWDAGADYKDPYHFYSEQALQEEGPFESAYDFFQSWVTMFVFEGHYNRDGGLGGKAPPHLWWLLPANIRREWRVAFRSAKREHEDSERLEREYEEEEKRLVEYRRAREKGALSKSEAYESEEGDEIYIGPDDDDADIFYGVSDIRLDVASTSDLDVNSHRKGKLQGKNTEKKSSRFHPCHRRARSLSSRSRVAWKQSSNRLIRRNLVRNGRLRKRPAANSH